MTPDQLRRIMPASGKRAALYAPFLTATCERFEIITGKRQASFIAQVAHESGSLLYVREIASGAAYDTGPKAKALGNTPEADGDGQKYKGAGLIQITGLDNMRRCGKALGLDLVNHPELLTVPTNAAMSAGWFWNDRKLNALADVGNFEKITRIINGGLTGIVERRAFWERAKKEFGA